MIESTGFFTEARRRRQAPRRRRQEGHHLRAGDRRGRHRRARRQLRRVRRATSTTSSPTPRARRTASRRSPRSLNDTVGIKHGLMTTIHAYTGDQACRTCRTRTCAARAPRRSTSSRRRPAPRRPSASCCPSSRASCHGFAIRAPVPTGSVVDLTFEAERETSVEEINAAFKAAADGPLKGILAVHRGPDRLDRHHREPALARSSTRADHGASTARSSRSSLVRQRVGLLEPRRRPGPAAACERGDAAMRTLDDVDLAGKRVLVRVDFNVPLRRRRRDHRRHADPRGAADARASCARRARARARWRTSGGRRARDPELSLRPGRRSASPS